MPESIYLSLIKVANYKHGWRGSKHTITINLECTKMKKNAAFLNFNTHCQTKSPEYSVYRSDYFKNYPNHFNFQKSCKESE